MFEASCLVTDFLSMQPHSRHPFSVGPREHLNQILNIVAVLRNGLNQYLPLLFSKLHDVIPRLANPMLQDAPEDVPLSKMDLFDDFSVSEPTQLAMPMPMDAVDFQSKFSVHEFEKKFTSSDMMHISSDSDAGRAAASQSPIS